MERNAFIQMWMLRKFVKKEIKINVHVIWRHHVMLEGQLQVTNALKN